jgi:DNA-binding FrmR family transcriptional regulator
MLINTPPFTKYPHVVYNVAGGEKMANDCCEKKTYRVEKEKRLINNRLSRIEGQIRGVKKMIGNDAYCNDILIQLAAIENSIKSLSNQVLENHLYNCIARDLENGKIDTIDEIISLFKRFNKR